MTTAPIGYRGEASWRDMSEFAAHFTKGTGNKSAYDVMLTILWAGTLLPSAKPYGAVTNLTELADSQRSVCFSEIPLDLLDRLIERRSYYGIAFRQDFLIENGGGRVWYLDKTGRVAKAFMEVVRQAMLGGIDSQDPVWTLTPFVEYPGDAPKKYRFEWEREWRVPGALNFQPEDVAFLFIPEHLHEDARDFFELAELHGTGPAYLCPYVDPTWDMDRIQEAFAPIPTPESSPVSYDTVCVYCGGPVMGGVCFQCGQPAAV